MNMKKLHEILKLKQTSLLRAVEGPIVRVILLFPQLSLKQDPRSPHVKGKIRQADVECMAAIRASTQNDDSLSIATQRPTSEMIRLRVS